MHGPKCDVKKSAFLASSHRQDLQVETIASAGLQKAPFPTYPPKSNSLSQGPIRQL